MKYLVILFSLLFIYSCGDDTVVTNNGGNPNTDFDIYFNRLSQNPPRVSSYTVKNDGSNLKLFSDTLSVGGSSLNNKILMATYDSLGLRAYCANYNGSNLTRLLTPGYQVVYFNLSQAGDKALFTTDVGNFMGVINTDGTGLTQISDNILGSEDVPKFSPNGNLIAYFESPPNHSRGLYIINPEGTYKKLLKDSIYTIVGFTLDWSPDGSKIIYQNNINNSGITKICSIDTSGNNYTEITEGWSAVWSPNVNKICFVQIVQNSPDISVMNTDGSEITNLTNTPALYEGNPMWSKDGSKILFSSEDLFHPTMYSVYDMNTNTSQIIADSGNGAIWK